MAGPQGQRQIPFSQVENAKKQGFKFAGQEEFNPWWLVPGSSRGQNFRLTPEEKRYQSDLTADTSQRIAREILATPGGREFVEGDGMDLAIGAAKEMARDAVGAHDIVAGKPQIGLTDLAEGRTRPQPSALRQFAEEPNQNFGESAGGAIESTGEFMAGEGALLQGTKLITRLAKVLGYTPKLAEAAKIEQEIQKGTTYGRIMQQALMQGTVGGGQTYLKTGGNAGAAATSGVATAGLSALLGAGANLSEARLRARLPGTENVGGQEFETPAPRDMPRPTKNQAAGQTAIKTAAQSTAQAHLEELNESRTEPESKPALPARTGPFQFNLKGVTPSEGAEGKISQSAAKVQGRHAFEQPQYTTSSAPTREPIRPGGPTANEGQMGADIRSAKTPAARADVVNAPGTITTQDPNVARGHLNNLDQTINSPEFQNFPPERQREILDARKDAADQLAAYHEDVRVNLPGYGKPQLPEVDTTQAVQKVGSYTDAARLVKGQAEAGYRHITDSLGLAGEDPQKLQQVKLAYQAAEQKYMGADTEAGLRAAEAELDTTHEQLRQLIQRVPNAISLKEFSGLNDAYRNALGLQKVAKAVDGSFTNFAESNAKRGYEYSGFNGKKLGDNLGNLLRTMGRGRVDRLVGRDNVDTLLRVAQLNTTNAGRSAFGVALRTVQDNLNKLPFHMHVGPIAAGGAIGRMTGIGWEAGAIGAWAGAEGMRRLSNMVVSNPKIAKNLIYALEYGAKPENYGPFIAQMVQQFTNQSQQEEQPNANSTR